MKKTVACLFVIMLMLAVTRCATQAPGPTELARPLQWPYEANAIHLHLKADPKLNLYQNKPHTLLICVYQVSDPNMFNQLTGEKTGLQKLLECERFDPGVTNTRRLVLQPGQDETFHLDRAEGTRYVGLVAGYYTLEKANVVRFFPIPVVAAGKGSGGAAAPSKPGPLSVDMYLAPQSLQVVGEK